MSAANCQRRRAWAILLFLGALAAAGAGAFAHDPVSEPPFQGAADAPITLVQYGDYQCAFCALFNREVKPLIAERFIETGAVRFEFRHFPWIGAASRRAAHAAYCAHAQGSFWPYHDYLYGPGGGALSSEELIAVAELLELDVDAFAHCLDDPAFAQRVEEEFRAARHARILTTPTFVVNGERLIAGARPYEFWEELFTRLLAELEGAAP